MIETSKEKSKGETKSMMKHARSKIFALLMVCVLAVAGIAWATTSIISKNVSNGAGNNPTPDAAFYAANASYLLDASVTPTPTGQVNSSPADVEVGLDLDSAANYGIGTYYTPIAPNPSQKGAINLAGFGLNLTPKHYTWTDTTIPLSHVVHDFYASIGTTGDVLRLYDSSGNTGVATIHTPTGQGIAGYTGGTYLENATLKALNGSVQPFGGGSMALGYLSTASATAPTLQIEANVTGPGTTTLAFPEFLVNGSYAKFYAASDVNIGKLQLSNAVGNFTILPSPSRIVKVTGLNPADYQTLSSTTELYIGDITVTPNAYTGTFDFGMTVPDAKTKLTVLDGATAATNANTNKTFGTLTGPGALSVGTQPEAGTISINHIATPPRILINSTFATVALPEATSMVDHTIAYLQGPGTLLVKKEQDTTKRVVLNNVANTALLAPRLDIEANATAVDNTALASPRYYAGLNGTGTLTMTNAPSILELVPHNINKINNFGGTWTTIPTTLRLNADTSALMQTLSSVSNIPNYTITQGILEFANPAAVRNISAGTAAIDVAGGTNASLKLAYNSAGYNFRGPAGTAAAATLNLTNGATLYLAPADINTDTSNTTLAFQGNAKPATFQTAGLTGGASNPINIVLDTTHLPAGNNYAVKLLSSPTAGQIDTTMLPANVNITLVPAGSITYTKHTAPGTADGYFYLVYTKAAGSSGGSGDPTKQSVVIDMTTIKSADVSGGKLTVIAVSGDKATTYDLSTTNVKIVVDENDPASVTNNGNVFNITYKYPTILNGVPITVSFKDSTGAKTSFTTTAKIVNGVSVLEFPATGLPSGTYEITLSSPSGRNPFYEGKVALAYAYTAPRGLVFTMTATKTGDEKGITAYATVTSADIPQTGVKVVFTLEDSDGNAVGTTYTQTTGADGKTGTVTYPNLANGTYTIRAAATGFNVETENVITITANSNPTPTPPTPTPSGSGSSGGCDAGFGAFALLAMAGGALVLRKKD